jgi:hypothetical protein
MTGQDFYNAFVQAYDPGDRMLTPASAEYLAKQAARKAAGLNDTQANN